MPLLSAEQKESYEKRYQALKILIENSPNPDYKFTDHEDFSLLDLAVLAGNEDRFLRHREYTDKNPGSRVSAINLALRYGDFKFFDEYKSSLLPDDLFVTGLDSPEAKDQYKKFVEDKVLPLLATDDPSQKFPPYCQKSYLEYAAEVGDTNTVEMFLKEHASSSDIKSLTRSAAKSAIFFNQHESLKILLNHCDLVDPSSPEDNLLLFAAVNGKKEAIDILLEKNKQDISNASYSMAESLPSMAKFRKEHQDNPGDSAVLFYFSKTTNEWKALDFMTGKTREHKVPEELRGQLNKALTLEPSAQEAALKNIVAENHFMPGFQADINATDANGKTLLFLALENKNYNAARELIEHKPNVNVTTHLGETLWHALAHCDPEFQQKFAGRLDKSTKNQTNIFGQTPEQAVNQSSSIAQNKIIDKIIYYHKLNNRDMEFVDRDGYCNGFVFLYQYFDAKKQLPVFYGMLDTISTWDPLSDSLKEKPKPPLDNLFESKQEAFETFINWLTWYQHNPGLQEQTGLQQFEREKQFEGEIDYLTKKLNYSKCDQEQIKELHEILATLPEQTRIEITSENHIIGYNVDAHENTGTPYFNYYDANFDAAVVLQLDAKQTATLFSHTLFEKRFTDRGEIPGLSFSIYSFPEDNLDFKQHHYFDGSTPKRTLPTSKETYDQFTNQSSNYYTPLHVAILTNSFSDFEKILQKDFIDVSHEDAHGMTAFDLALSSGNPEFCRSLLRHPSPNLDRILSKAYYENHTAVVDDALENPRSQELNGLFLAALDKHDENLLVRLLEGNHVNRNFAAAEFLKPEISIAIDHQNISETDFHRMTLRWAANAQKNEKLQDKMVIRDHTGTLRCFSLPFNSSTGLPTELSSDTELINCIKDSDNPKKALMDHPSYKNARATFLSKTPTESTCSPEDRAKLTTIIKSMTNAGFNEATLAKSDRPASSPRP